MLDAFIDTRPAPALRRLQKKIFSMALRWPAARSKTHSSLPSGVVPCGTVIILGSDPALEELSYTTPPLPGLSRNLVNCFHQLG